MCQFPGFARTGLCIQPAVTPSPCGVTPGFPIRKSPDQCSFDSSPELIAAYHVLLRLSTPRHPPCTLSNLIAQMTDSRRIRHLANQGTFGANDTPSCRFLRDAVTSRKPRTLKRFNLVEIAFLPAFVIRPTPGRARCRRMRFHVFNCQRS